MIQMSGVEMIILSGVCNPCDTDDRSCKSHCKLSWKYVAVITLHSKLTSIPCEKTL